jgi:Protein of unknown function (DUF1420)
VVMLVGLIAARRAQRLSLALLILGGCFSIVALPVFARNFVFYGDPISPLLERWRPGGDPALIAFAQKTLREWGGSVTLGRVARLPWDLAITFNPGALHHVLGLGAYAFLLAFRERGPMRRLLLAALGAFALVVMFSQFYPRFFLEPYLWCAAAAVAVPWHGLKSLFFKALTVQAVVVAGVGVYLASILLPGALTQAGRDRVMTKMALGYSEAKWLDATLPPDAVVLTSGRSYALLPRSFVVADRYRWDPSTHTNASDWKEQLTAMLREKRVTVLVSEYPIGAPVYSWLAERYGTRLVGPAEFRFAARSPFNRGDLIRSVAIHLNGHMANVEESR